MKTSGMSVWESGRRDLVEVGNSGNGWLAGSRRSPGDDLGSQLKKNYGAFTADRYKCSVLVWDHPSKGMRREVCRNGLTNLRRDVSYEVLGAWYTVLA